MARTALGQALFMMFLPDSPLTLKEFLVNEPVPLADVFRTVFRFLKGRRDAVVFGSQAVNVYVDEPRMTNDIDVLSTHAGDVAEDLRDYLSESFHVAVRIRAIKGKGFRIYQLRKPQNRHLVDVRQVLRFPETRTVNHVNVVAPPALIVMKVQSLAARKRTEKGLTDILDLHRLLRRFPRLRARNGVVARALEKFENSESLLHTWGEVLDQDLHESGKEKW